MSFERGAVYRRADLHARYGGQTRSRISTPALHNFIMLFATDVNGGSDYPSGWTSYGIFRFTGEGRFGHMSFTRGNRALRNHMHDGKAVYLFVPTTAHNLNLFRFEGEFVYRGHFYKEGYDQRNKMRRMIVFILKPLAQPPQAL